MLAQMGFGMEPLLLRCRKTNRTFDSGFANDPGCLAEVWNATIRVTCPHCQEEHEIKIREAFLINTLSREIMGAGKSNVAA
jgi:hypothetical protein